jgi:hypothetical protein
LCDRDVRVSGLGRLLSGTIEGALHA